jgi:outer membrane protein assembly factor BamB
MDHMPHCPDKEQRTVKARISILIAACLVMAAGCGRSPDGHRPETSAAPPVEAISPTVAWSQTIRDGQIASAVIEDGVAYYHFKNEWESIPDRIKAYDLETWQTKWTIITTTHTHLLLGNDKLFLLDRDESVLSAISVEDGATVWRVPLPAKERPYRYELAFGSGLLFYSVRDLLYALDADDGRVMWRNVATSGFYINQAWGGASRTHQEYDALSYVDGVLYARLWGPTGGEDMESLILAMNASNGQEKWRFAFTIPSPAESGPKMAASRPAFEGNVLFFGDWGGRAHLLDKETGEIVWQKDIAMLPVVRPLLQDDRAYYATHPSLSCLSAGSGKELWSTSLSRVWIRSPIRVQAGVVMFVAEYFQEEQVKLVLLDNQTGDLVATVDMPMTGRCPRCVMAMEIEQNKLYVVREQSIVAIDLVLPPGQ